MIITSGLEQGVLIQRYKRFLADVVTSEGKTITIHCPNTGAMTNCKDPGSTVWYSTSDNLKRKYPHTWEIVQAPDGPVVGINTGLSNHLVEEALVNDVIGELAGFDSIRREVKYGEQSSRIDFLLEYPPNFANRKCYVEVKNVTLSFGDGIGIFPDAKTSRGQKHLQELIAMKAQGCRSVLLFCVQHSEIANVGPADEIDPVYGKLLREAASAGVELLAYKAAFNVEAGEISLTTQLPVLL